MNTNPRRIDVHHHILPPNFVSALNSLNIPWTGGPEVPSWSLARAHDTMGELGIDEDDGLMPVEKTAKIRDLLISSSGVYHPAGSPGSDRTGA